jgi:hypothetical protein
MQIKDPLRDVVVAIEFDTWKIIGSINPAKKAPKTFALKDIFIFTLLKNQLNDY